MVLRLKDTVAKLSDKLDAKSDVGPTKGSYGPVNEYLTTQKTPTSSGIVMTKTPQQLEFEENEQLKRANGR